MVGSIPWFLYGIEQRNKLFKPYARVVLEGVSHLNVMHVRFVWRWFKSIKTLLGAIRMLSLCLNFEAKENRSIEEHCAAHPCSTGE